MLKKTNSFVGLIIVFIIFIGLFIPSLILYFNEPFPNIILLPTSRVIYDHGFAESSHNASTHYSEKYDKTYNYIFPEHFDQKGYEKVIRTALDNGTETIVSLNYDNCNNAIDELADYYPDATFIIIDNSSVDISQRHENVISTTFLASQASFEAGILASMYLIANFEDANDWNIGGWGGLQISSVISLLSGLEQGINWFNYYFFGTDIYGNDVRNNPNYSDAPVESLLLEPGQKINLIDYKGGTFDYGSDDPNSYYEAKPSNSNWYSNSFNLTDGVPLATGYMSEDVNAKVLIPIAGGQTADALNVISSYYDPQSNPIQVIGMDTNAKDAYPDYTDEILFSVIKNVSLGTFYSLWQADKRYENPDETTNDPDYDPNDPLKNPFLMEETVSNGGWVKESDNPNQNIYVGTFENQGVGISDMDEKSADDPSQNSKLYQSWLDLFEIYPDLTNFYEDNYEGFLQFIADSFDAQKFVGPDDNPIETSSSSFSINNSGSTDAAESDFPTTEGNGLWIPFWNKN